MRNYVKTTGKTGLHILLPLGRQFTYEQSRTLGELIARLMLKEVGDIATITRHVGGTRFISTTYRTDMDRQS